MARITLKAARVNAGYDQKSAAKLLGISNSTLGKWERGENYPGVDKVQELCALYGIRYDDIVFSSKRIDTTLERVLSNSIVRR